MKKILISVLTILVAISSFALFAAAAEAPSYALADKSIEANEEFTIDVEIANNPGIISLRLEISYDSTVLELLSVEDTGLLNGFTTPAATIASPYTLRWADSLATSDNTANGKIVTLHFKALTENTSTDITVTHKEARNTSGEKIEFATDSSAIMIAAAPCEHTFTNYVSDGNATCEADGTKTAYCDNGCGETNTIADVGSKLNHNFAVEEKSAVTLKTAATCTEDAVYYLRCDCGAVSTEDTFTDNDTALGHDFTIAKNDAENHWTQCSRCSESTEKTAHTDADGQWEINANEHWYTCSCGQTFDKAAHSGGTATETEKAVCETCGTEYGTIDSCTHSGKKEIRNAKSATCSENGYSGDTYCTECGEMIKQGIVVKATGKHNWKVVKRVNATTDKKGYILYGCKDCEETKRVAVSYSVATGLENILAPAAAVVLLSGATFFGCKKMNRKKDEE